ncbi:MAG: hypothetical protein RR005_08045 [Mucinivorans sp.]
MKNVTIELISFEDVYNELRGMTKEHVALKKDSSTKYIGTFHGDRLIGCVGYQMIGSVLRYKGDFVDNELLLSGKTFLATKIGLITFLHYHLTLLTAINQPK